MRDFTHAAVFVLLVLAFAAGGCSDAPPPGDGEPDARTEVEADEYELRMGPITIPPGTEEVQCIEIRLGNELPIKIHEINNNLGDISHHFILYRSTATEEMLEPYDCESIENLVSPDNGVPLMITQKYEETLTLPEGVAFELDANQMLRMELHYINAGDQPKDVEVVSKLRPIPDAEFEHAADFLFIGNPDINIPPGATQTLGPTYMPLPVELADSKFFGITGHQHQWGTDVQVFAAEDETDPGTPVYQLPNFNWDEPETVYHDPPFQVPELGGFKFTCTWTNGSSSTVGFGEGVNDEMCFFWAYYYPSLGPRTCFHTDQLDAPLDICCPGNQLCNLVDDFYN